MSRRSIVKLSFLTIFLISAFVGIYWYTSPERCSSDYGGLLRNEFSDDSAYDMCTNYYDMPIFKSNEKALLKARDDFREALVVISASYNIRSISNDNYEQFLAYALELNIDDASIDANARNLAQFLAIYDNGLKRAKPYLECIFTKTFYVIDAMDHYENGKDYNYVILKNPNTLEPMMIKLTNELRQRFETGMYFEVSFVNDKRYTGSYSDYVGLFERLLIKGIEATVKSEGEQLQQNGCR